MINKKDIERVIKLIITDFYSSIVINIFKDYQHCDYQSYDYQRYEYTIISGTAVEYCMGNLGY